MLLAILTSVPGAATSDEPRRCGTTPAASRNLLAFHVFAGQRSPRADAEPGEGDRDVDDVAVLQDRGDLVARANPLDLTGIALRFAPNATGGYDVVPLNLAPETGTTRLRLGDDAAVAVELPFAFPFFGRRHTRTYVHSDGSLSFVAPDTAPADRGLGSLLAGPPRIAPFFADLAPGTSGRVAVSLRADRALVSWSDVPGVGQTNRNSFEAVLHADGAIDFVYGELETLEAVAGVSPGGTESFAGADLSRGQPRGTAGALLEGFWRRDHLDLVATLQRFLGGHPDVFEQVVVYTTRPLSPQPDSLAFEVNVRNEVRGIGLETRDDSRAWGSSGVLASAVFMDSVDPYLNVDGFEILGHEVGHRWLARLRFRDARGTSGALLGRGDVHWSFFLDTDASVLEGNDIAELGDGLFETTGIVSGYSALDLYAMGLVSPAELAPFFYVAEADDFRPARSYRVSSGPEVGVQFSGIRREVQIADVVAAMGPRVPSAGNAPRRLRQAFVLVADAAAPASGERLAAVARIRRRFEAWYSGATWGRGSVDTTLP